MLTSYASSLETALFPVEVTSATTCVKLLQRLLPPVLSLPQVAYYLLWLNEKPTAKSEDEIMKEAADSIIQSQEDRKDNDTDLKKPYGARLMQGLMNLLFKQGFTVAKLAEEEKTNLDPFGIDVKVIWAGGLQYEDTRQRKERVFDRNRVDVLYLILECLGTQIYEEKRSANNLFAMYAGCGKAQNVKNMFFSLINTVVSYDWRGYVSSIVDRVGNPVYECPCGGLRHAIRPVLDRAVRND